MIRKVIGLYFSPIGRTAGMIRMLTQDIAAELRSCSPEEISLEYHDLLSLQANSVKIDEETVAVIGMPVYVGKIPLPGLSAIRHINGNGAMTFTAVSYGGRSYGNALYELQHFTEQQGFKVIGAGAFSVKEKDNSKGKSKSEAGSRDGHTLDSSAVEEFGKAASAKIKRLAGCDIEGLKVKPAPLEVSGRLPIHKISRISPKAAQIAQGFFERICIRRRESEWYL
jgi:hypothetical protein